MTVVDTTFVTGGTMSYRVFAVREGIYSTAGTTSKAYTVSALSVTDMTVVNLNTAYYIQYEKPTSRFIDHVEIYMDSQTTSAALSRSNATIVYSGQNASYMRNVNTSSNFHQFWVEIVTS
jgi:arylamine N-acetyltransferase